MKCVIFYRVEADLRLAKTALVETMRLFNSLVSSSPHECNCNIYAGNAYKMADAMLAERQKRDE